MGGTYLKRPLTKQREVEIFLPVVRAEHDQICRAGFKNQQQQKHGYRKKIRGDLFEKENVF